MGTYISTLFGDLTQDIPLALHPDTKGSQIILDTSQCIATRVATFHDGIIFSNRPVKVKEKVTMEILKEDGRWIGGLRLGFTSENPSLMDSRDLPPYACPNLVKQGKCWAAVIPNEYVGEGTIVSFWVTRKGSVFFSIEHEPGSHLLLEDVPVKKPLWAVIDIYGRTKAILLLDPSKPKTSKYESSQLLLNAAGQNESVCGHFGEHNSIGKECVVCLCRKANVAMLPCWHANFCFCCATRILYSSGCCPLCRQKVKKILCISAQAEEGITAKWLEEVDGSQLPP